MTKVEIARMITFIVREEMKKQLPSLIERVLTEQYLKRMVNERVGRPSAPLVEADDDIPEPEENDHDGIYHPDQPNLKGRTNTNETVRKLLGRENRLAFLYEDVKPIPSTTSLPSPESIDLDKLGFDFDRIKRLVNTKPSVVSRPVEDTRRVRPELDRMVDTRSSSVSGQDRLSVPSRSRASVSGLFGSSADFPDEPITFED